MKKYLLLVLSLVLSLQWFSVAQAEPNKFLMEKFKYVDAYPRISSDPKSTESPQGLLFRGSVPVDASHTKFTMDELLQAMNDAYKTISSKDLPFDSKKIRLVDVAVYGRTEAKTELPGRYFTITEFNAMTGQQIGDAFISDPKQFQEGKIYPDAPNAASAKVNGKPVTVYTQFLWWDAHDAATPADAKKKTVYTDGTVSLIDVMQKLMGQKTAYTSNVEFGDVASDEIVLIYLHCQHGSDRTGAMIGAYLLQTNLGLKTPIANTPLVSASDYAWYGSQVFVGSSASDWSASHNETLLGEYCVNWLRPRVGESLPCLPADSKDKSAEKAYPFRSSMTQQTVQFSGMKDNKTGFTILVGPDYGTGHGLTTMIDNGHISDNAALPFTVGTYKIYTSNPSGYFLNPETKEKLTEVTVGVNAHPVVMYSAGNTKSMSFQVIYPDDVKATLKNAAISSKDRFDLLKYAGAQTLQMTQGEKTADCHLTLTVNDIKLADEPLCKVIKKTSTADMITLDLQGAVPDTSKKEGFQVQIHYSPTVPTKVMLGSQVIDKNDMTVESKTLTSPVNLQAEQNGVTASCVLTIGKDDLTLAKTPFCDLITVARPSGKVLLQLPDDISGNPAPGPSTKEVSFTVPATMHVVVNNKQVLDGARWQLNDFQKPQTLVATEGTLTASAALKKSGDTLSVVPNSGTLSTSESLSVRATSQDEIAVSLSEPLPAPSATVTTLRFGLPATVSVQVNDQVFTAKTESAKRQYAFPWNATVMLTLTGANGVQRTCALSVDAQGAVMIPKDPDAKDPHCQGLKAKDGTLYIPSF